MSRVRLVLLSLVAVLSVGAMLASSASAAISFQWFVNGSLLPAGQSRTFTASADGSFALTGTAGGAAALLLSNKLKVQPGAKIFGGKPGTNEEVVEFENVVVDKPAGCAVEGGTVVTNLLKSEIVEGQSGGHGNGEPLVLFIPKTGTTFTSFLLLNKGAENCPLKGIKPTVLGSVLALPLPQGTEALTGGLDFEAITKEFLLSTGGAAEKAGLTFAGSPATLTGLSLVLLESHEKFGVF